MSIVELKRGPSLLVRCKCVLLGMREKDMLSRSYDEVHWGSQQTQARGMKQPAGMLVSLEVETVLAGMRMQEKSFGNQQLHPIPQMLCRLRPVSTCSHELRSEHGHCNVVSDL